MFVKIRCKICGKEGFYDFGMLEKEEVLSFGILERTKAVTCMMGGHKEEAPLEDVFEFIWNEDPVGVSIHPKGTPLTLPNEPVKQEIEFKVPEANIEDEEEEFLKSIESSTNEYYTLEQLQEDETITIESDALGKLLCTKLQGDDEERLIAFNKTSSPKGVTYYYL